MIRKCGPVRNRPGKRGAGRPVAALAAVSAALIGTAGQVPSAYAAPSPTAQRAGSYPVGSHVGSGWHRNATLLGAPTGPEVPVTAFGQTGYTQQYADGHELVSSSFGVFEISGGLRTAFGLNVATFGWPTTSQYSVNDVGGSSGVEQDFSTVASGARTGQLTYRWKSNGVAYFVRAGMYTRFISSGGMSANGWPTADQAYLGRCAEWAQQFTKSSTVYFDTRFCPAPQYAQPQQSQAGDGPGYALGYGYSGSAVYFAQRALGIASGNMSTVIGPQTSGAIKNFQRSHGQPVTGTINEATWTALHTGMPFSTSTWPNPSSVATDATAAVRREAVVSYAKRMVGSRYIWGGTGNAGSPAGFDCAGFALQAVRAGGIRLLWATNWFDVYPPSDLARVLWQDTELQHVSTASLRPGDLVFYGDSSRVRHVSIYIGDGQAVNAVGQRVQTLSVWNTSGWSTIYGAVRPVSSTGSSASGVQVDAGAGPKSLARALPDPTKVNNAASSLIIAGRPLAPVPVTVAGGTLRASERQIHKAGVIAAVQAGDRLTGIPAGSEVVWIGAGFVLGLSRTQGATAPKGATQALVLSVGNAAGLGIDSPVSKG